uniref:BZIP domain-containing protein n=1 Tax=Globisporangium ultimum (strain ATCC 200006 / CBS 805.95 / DAOM BR144) TaxID=431595 RepID=K3WXF7_GLOUD
MTTTKVDPRLGLCTGSDAFDAQELEELWVAISSDDNEQNEESRAPQPVMGHAPGASMMDLLLAPLDAPTVAQVKSVRSKKTEQAGAKRKPRTFTPAQVDMRRKRNRDSMRRVRQRKQVEVDVLRKKMELLQDKLHELHVVRDTQTTSKLASSLAAWENTESVHTTVSPAKARSEREVQELLEEIRALQCEQVSLHNAVLGHEQVSATLAQIIEESKALHLTSPEASIFESLLHQDEDEFQWVNDVLSLLPPLSRANVYKLVRQSYLDVVDRITAAAASRHANANKVLGWSDKRQVSGQWADFVFTKEFMNEDMDALVGRTWKALTSSNQSDGFQSQGLHLKILEKLNDDALLLARTSYFPVDDRNYSSIYVLIRVKTDDGYVIGGRTICPTPENEERMAAALGPDRSYAHMFYGLMFSRLNTGISEDGIENITFKQPQSQQRGCQIKYGGRIGNGSVQYAQSWAMDVLLAVLRWETACVAPLYRLTS